MHRMIRALCVPCVAALVLLPSLVRAAGADDEQRKLDALVQSLRDKGEPVLPADLAAKPVPDAENAALLLREAAASIDGQSAAYQAYDKLEAIRLPLKPDEVPIYRAFVQENAKALAKVEEAMRRPGVNWGTKYESPLVKVLLPDLSEQRKLANLMRAATFDAYTRGEHRQALKYVEQLRFVGAAVDRQPILISHLVAIGCYTIAADSLIQMSPGLELQAAGRNDPRAATPAQVDALIAAILDESAQRDGMRRSLAGERVSICDTANALLSGTVQFSEFRSVSDACQGKDEPPPEVDWVALRPAVLTDVRLSIEYFTGLIDASQSADLPSFLRRLPADFPAQAKRDWNQHLYASCFLPDLSRSVTVHFRLIADQRLAAVALAARRYAVDNGKLPAALADLAPRYLKAIPLDPMTIGASLLYKSGEKPIIYSVGDNGTDDGGSEQPLRGQTTSPWQLQDRVVRLYRTER